MKKKQGHFKRNWDIYTLTLSLLSALIVLILAFSASDYGSLFFFFIFLILISSISFPLSIISLIRQIRNKSLSKIRLIIIIPILIGGTISFFWLIIHII